MTSNVSSRSAPKPNDSSSKAGTKNLARAGQEQFTRWPSSAAHGTLIADV